MCLFALLLLYRIVTCGQHYKCLNFKWTVTSVCYKAIIGYIVITAITHCHELRRSDNCQWKPTKLQKDFQFERNTLLVWMTIAVVFVNVFPRVGRFSIKFCQGIIDYVCLLFSAESGPGLWDSSGAWTWKCCPGCGQGSAHACWYPGGECQSVRTWSCVCVHACVWSCRLLFVSRVISDITNVNVDDPESVCICVCVCVCVCLSICPSVPRKRFTGNYWSHHHKTWHSGCLRHENASRVNYIDRDLHSRSQILIMRIINVRLFQKLFKAIPIKFAVKIF